MQSTIKQSMHSPPLVESPFQLSLRERHWATWLFPRPGRPHIAITTPANFRGDLVIPGVLTAILSLGSGSHEKTRWIIVQINRIFVGGHISSRVVTNDRTENALCKKKPPRANAHDLARKFGALFNFFREIRIIVISTKNNWLRRCFEISKNLCCKFPSVRTAIMFYNDKRLK